MARLHDKQDKLTITNFLRLARNAVIKRENDDGSESYGRGKVKTLTAASTLKLADHDGIFVLNSATEFETVLPAPKPGLALTFIVGAAPSGASYTVVTANSDNIIRGLVVSADLNAASDGDSEASGGDTITFADGVADEGDRVELVADGTHWYIKGYSKTFNGITITTAS
ncbi:hypothetical protein HBA55_29695 [Pseudomaricurvus alkylphenolicus]|uniref:hypothetical protein n=1 Tax=Pseudomaricurvus alkylphenolicus TaxID=1306991 RepID=UPI00141E0E8A|nr:hypothetical protein [Pseudomaricurvus alkylphenolicus]NIB43813.1 hypothetical protein [Pseudomaricurvus alkylphenolicus]